MAGVPDPTTTDGFPAPGAEQKETCTVCMAAEPIWRMACLHFFACHPCFQQAQEQGNLRLVHQCPLCRNAVDEFVHNITGERVVRPPAPERPPEALVQQEDDDEGEDIDLEEESDPDLDEEAEEMEATATASEMRLLQQTMHAHELGDGDYQPDPDDDTDDDETEGDDEEEEEEDESSDSTD
jgi:hypothetical protein